MDFSAEAQVLEQALVAAGIPLDQCRTTEANRWVLRRGSAFIIVLFKETQDHKGDVGVFVVLAHMMDLPKDEERQNSLAKYLLDTNHGFISERFTHYEGAIYIMSARTVKDLQGSEMMDMIDSTSFWADRFDDEMKQQFGDKEAPSDDDNNQQR